MVDIATIGYVADTSGLKQTEAALDSLSAKSKTVATSMDALGASAGTAASSVTSAGQAATGAGSSIGGLGEQVRKTQDGMNQGATATTRYAAELKKAQDAVRAQLSAAGSVTGPFMPGASPVAQEMDRMRAQFSPLFAAQQQYRTQLAEINTANKAGALTTKEYSDAVMNTKVAFVQQVNSIRGVSDAFASQKPIIDNAAHAHGNMSTQAMSLQHALRGSIEQLALGVPPTMVLTQQMNHLAYAASGPGGIVGAFKEVKTMLTGAGSWFLSLITPAVATFGAIAAAVGLGVSALGSYAAAQKQVDVALSGAGRASGATRTDVNAIATTASSPLGLSTSEAREFATTLASTGKIGVDVMTSLTKLGHDFATTLGVDGKEAAATLSKALSDPVAGAEQLNQKLGFMDAAQQRQIRNLTEQNRLGDAQRIIVTGIETSILKASQVTGFWSTTWTAISNAVSNTYDGLGRVLSRATGIGATLDDQYKDAVVKLNDLKQRQTQGFSFDSSFSLMSAPKDQEIAAAQTEVDALTKKLQAQRDASEAARQRLESFKVAAAAMNLLPEIEQVDKLKNTQDLLVKTMIDVQLSGGPASEILARLGITYTQLGEAVARATSQVTNFKTEFEHATDAQRVQMQALTAFSPQAKGDVAYQQRLNAELHAGTEQIKAQTLAEGDRAIAIKGVAVALSEAARERLLAADQAKATADLELGLIGKQIGQQTQLRADLQARQQLEQEASRNRTAFDEAEYARLQKKNAVLGEIAQKTAEVRMIDQISFDRAQLGRTDAEAVAASQLRAAGIDANSPTGQALAQQIKLNEALKVTKSVLTDVSTSFAKDFKNAVAGGADAFTALKTAAGNALNSISDKLIEIAMKDLVAKAFGGSGSGGGLGSILSLVTGSAGAGSAAGSVNVVGSAGSMAVPTFFADGGYTGNSSRSSVAGMVHGQEFVVNADATRQHLSLLRAINDNRLPGYADGGYVGTPPPPALSSGRSGGGDVVHVTFAPSYNVQGSGEEIGLLRQQMAQDRADFTSRTIKAVQDAKSRRVAGV